MLNSPPDVYQRPTVTLIERFHVGSASGVYRDHACSTGDSVRFFYYNNISV